MAKPGEVYHDRVFDSEVSVISVDEDIVLVIDRIGGSGEREIRRADWDHNISVGRYEKIKDYQKEQMKMDELEMEHYDEYVEMGEVELDETERGIFDY